MSVDQISTFIANLGFPIAVAVAAILVIWKLGSQIVAAQCRNLDLAGEQFKKIADTQDERSRQVTEKFSQIVVALNDISSSKAKFLEDNRINKELLSSLAESSKNTQESTKLIEKSNQAIATTLTTGALCRFIPVRGDLKPT